MSALLGDLSADLEQDKKRAVSNDDLEVALAIKHTATVVAHLQSHPSSAKDLLIALEAHMEDDDDDDDNDDDDGDDEW